MKDGVHVVLRYYIFSKGKTILSYVRHDCNPTEKLCLICEKKIVKSK